LENYIDFYFCDEFQPLDVKMRVTGNWFVGRRTYTAFICYLV